MAPDANSRQPSRPAALQAASSQQPATSNQQPATSNQQPATSNQQMVTPALDPSSRARGARATRISGHFHHEPRSRRGHTNVHGEENAAVGCQFMHASRVDEVGEEVSRRFAPASVLRGSRAKRGLPRTRSGRGSGAAVVTRAAGSARSRRRSSSVVGARGWLSSARMRRHPRTRSAVGRVNCCAAWMSRAVPVRRATEVLPRGWPSCRASSVASLDAVEVRTPRGPWPVFGGQTRP